MRDDRFSKVLCEKCRKLNYVLKSARKSLLLAAERIPVGIPFRIGMRPDRLFSFLSVVSIIGAGILGGENHEFLVLKATN